MFWMALVVASTDCTYVGNELLGSHSTGSDLQQLSIPPVACSYEQSTVLLLVVVKELKLHTLRSVAPLT